MITDSKYLPKLSAARWIALAAIEIMLGFFMIGLGYYYLLLLLAAIPVFFLLCQKPIYAYFALIFGFPNYVLGSIPLGGLGGDYHFGEPDVGLLEALLILALLVWVINKLVLKKEFIIDKESMGFPLFLLLTWVLLSFFWTPNPKTATLQILKTIRGVLVFFLTVNLVKDKKDLRMVMVAWIVLGTALAVIGLHETMTHGLKEATSKMFMPGKPELRRLGHDIRTTTFFHSADQLGFVLNISFIMGLILYLTSISKAHRSTLLVVLGTMLIAIISTFSRKSWLGIALTMGLFGMQNRRIVSLALWPLLGVLLFILLGGGEFVDALYNRFQTFFLPIEEAIPQRTKTWEVAWALFMQNPIIGNGIGSFAALASEAGSKLTFTHSFFFYILVEMGTVGTILFGWFVLRIVVRIRHLLLMATQEFQKILYAGCASLFAVLIVQAGFKQMALSNAMAWGSVGFVVALLKTYRVPPYGKGQIYE